MDGDGHVLELVPLFADFVRDHGRSDLVDSLPILQGTKYKASELTTEQRRLAGIYPAFWAVPADAEYYATVSTPGRYYERLADAGIDFSVLYPTMALSFPQLLDDDMRVTVCRLYNEFMAEEYRPYADRFTVAAVIPMCTPHEAVDAMQHAKQIGAKVALIPSFVRRPMPGDRWPPEDPFFGSRSPVFTTAGWVDTFGIDSAHDYDAVWATAIELGFPLASHSHSIGFSDRSSVSTFMYNQIGSFASSGVMLAKSLFFGGVTRRFPDLRVALLEGGVAEGLRLYVNLVSVWQKRGRPGIRRLDPANIDRAELTRLLRESDPRLARYSPDEILVLSGYTDGEPDEFAAAGLESEADIADRYCRNFFWGCEADDPLVGIAFDPRLTPAGARVPVFMGSDIGHWDVPDFDAPLEEAYELVEQGIIDLEAFREFVFGNPVRFYGAFGAEFFRGTSIEKEATTELSHR